MKLFELKPKESIGPFYLSMSKQEVEKIVGTVSYRKVESEKIKGIEKSSHYESCLHLEYEQNRVIFIGLMYDDGLSLVYENQDLFKLKDVEILSIFNQLGDYDKNLSDLEYMYVYNDLQLAFYREMYPAILKQEMDALLPDDPEYNEQLECYIEAIEKYQYFQQFIVFRKDYYTLC
ncbi:MAG: hypothetical protein HQK65_23500 [Desulfamplus sp.]|nr:hypothetical protein [Desulfamplus sp.]